MLMNKKGRVIPIKRKELLHQVILQCQKYLSTADSLQMIEVLKYLKVSLLKIKCTAKGYRKLQCI